MDLARKDYETQKIQANQRLDSHRKKNAYIIGMLGCEKSRGVYDNLLSQKSGASAQIGAAERRYQERVANANKIDFSKLNDPSQQPFAKDISSLKKAAKA